MAIKLVADLHGRFNDLGSEINPQDTLIVLGDVLDLIDWADISGILPEVVGREALIEKLMTAVAKGPAAAVTLRDELISEKGGYSPELMSRITGQYEDFARVLREIGCKTYVIYGNADIPDFLESALETVENTVIARGTAEINGCLFGFVPGAIYSPFHMPAEIGDEEFGERLRELGAVDVLCTHVPPQTEEAVLDIVAGRPVEGSTSLLEYIQTNNPAFLYHGHVHQPAQRELTIGSTRVINVAYYKRQGYVHTH